MYREPAAIIGAISTAVTAVLALLVAFGIDLTDGQQAAILGVIAGVGPVVTGILIRRTVYSPATRDAQVAAAATSAPDAS